MNTNSPMQKIEQILKSSTLPSHKIECYGRQITVECISRDSCSKWAQLLGKFATVRGMIKSYAYVGDSRNSGQPKIFDVWRVYAAIR